MCPLAQVCLGNSQVPQTEHRILVSTEGLQRRKCFECCTHHIHAARNSIFSSSCITALLGISHIITVLLIFVALDFFLSSTLRVLQTLNTV